MPTQNAKDRLAKLAERQFGRVSRAQLKRLGVSDATVRDWVEQGYLHRVLPRVYAVGHCATTLEAELAGALLYAGRGAMLSHATAAWWLGLADARPRVIDVSTSRRCLSTAGIRVHGRRAGVERTWHRRLPVTPLAQTLLDYATVATLSKLRRALAQADYQGVLGPPIQEAILAQRRPGCAKLRRALERHQPLLANSRSALEADFLELCESAELPLPEINARAEGWTVDALWRRERVVVELDGWRNHRTPAQVRRDRQKEAELRMAGYIVLRYSYEQVTRHPDLVIGELRAVLAERGQAA